MAIAIFFRKIHSVYARAIAKLRATRMYFRAYFDPGLHIGKRCSFGRGVVLRASDGGVISLGSDVSIGRGVQIVAQQGRINIHDNVHIGDGCILVCRSGIDIGAETLIAEYVVIRDQDHETSSRPVRHAGFRTAPVRIGRDVWLGCKATVLRGVTICDGAVVGAHALVRSDVPAGMLAVGVPARVVGPA